MKQLNPIKAAKYQPGIALFVSIFGKRKNWEYSSNGFNGIAWFESGNIRARFIVKEPESNIGSMFFTFILEILVDKKPIKVLEFSKDYPLREPFHFDLFKEHFKKFLSLLQIKNKRTLESLSSVIQLINSV